MADERHGLSAMIRALCALAADRADQLKTLNTQQCPI